MSDLTLEFLFVPGCPTEHTAPQLLRSVLSELSLPHDFDSLPVHTDQEARRRCFLGSPTIRVNGRDIDPSAERREDYGLG